MFSASQCSKRALVLIVDDDFLLRESLSLILAGEGYMVAVAENGVEALKRLRSGERPGLILLDLRMPIMDGWRFRTEQQQDPALASIPVVLMTALNEVRGDEDTLKPAEHLQKPVETACLLETVKRHCQT